uniref:G-protein coupled receptors family 1 profile domain-containing protein n=1 Tax=Zosterops lateralis melanops TaxID=1220523 RepID=A0A8D2PBE5_ZOSLA
MSSRGMRLKMSNSSSISHFLLLALADTWQLQLLHFCLFLGISLAALLGLIISAAACGHHLHSPMFFFLLNLALSDLGSILTTVPKAMHNSLWDTSPVINVPNQQLAYQELDYKVIKELRAPVKESSTSSHHVLSYQESISTTDVLTPQD